MKHQNYLFLGGFIQSAVLCVQAKFSFKSYTTVTVYAAGHVKQNMVQAGSFFASRCRRKKTASTKNFNLLLTSA
jgi:hypothetical protein